MLVRKCDRCGYDGNGVNTYILRNVNNHVDDSSQEFDWCPACYEGFIDFMRQFDDVVKPVKKDDSDEHDKFEAWFNKTMKNAIIESIREQYSQHDQVVPEWLSIGDISVYKGCKTCKYLRVYSNSAPCVICANFDKWEADK